MKLSKELMLERAAIAIFWSERDADDSERDAFGSRQWKHETDEAKAHAKAALESLGVDLDKLADWVGRRTRY